NFVNRLFFVTPGSDGDGDGELHYYDKCHLFAMGGEHERYQPGKQRSVVNYKGWRFLLTVCYDLRFPVFCRNRNDYDVMLCVANWPQSRRHPWRTLLQARAIENQAYVLGVNRVGKDGNGLEYSGDSMAVNFWGEIVADGPQGKEQLLNATLDRETLLAARKSFPVANDADAFELT
ncbi:MAG: omega-amidase, partial [Kiritimatiellia bacterium]